MQSKADLCVMRYLDYQEVEVDDIFKFYLNNKLDFSLHKGQTIGFFAWQKNIKFVENIIGLTGKLLTEE